jgi:hypothetical protein
MLPATSDRNALRLTMGSPPADEHDAIRHRQPPF